MQPRVYVYTNQKAVSLQLKELLMLKMKKRGIAIVPQGQPFDYLITIGGDGTLLSAFHQYQSMLSTIQFIGIHTGHLGFYADWQSYELDELVDNLLAVDQKDPVSYPLLSIEVTQQDGTITKYLALNECSLRSNTGTMVSDVYVKNRFFETLRSDGLCVATPTGSTGLSKSLGGAVMHPRLDAIQLTEIASLNNRVYRSLGSPMIIPKDEWFRIEPSIRGKASMFTLMFDNVTLENYPVHAIRLQIADERIRFANIRHTHFWDRVEASFIGRNYQPEIKLNNQLK
ncbi:NAD kinase [Tuanshanicoccus lijuaniae]|uniref:NAD kinase n=1 Tax=Aerococcaceae bacterium zg-1292 TaxID=2774330 RepID=UPI001BD826C3|nr:NAD kinase [Aerococcaceae bacterium zg-BR9]MBF6626300.1 NAD kinase [Aerococcaceae bacterium zg-BR9]MBF6978148.1 NAD kinase [Aerococcaceae bacterium zg-BR22]MBS4456283.1 NAD kinase [Aerococcaceae bacterium zg-A91]MBS4458130.1 NAD kinase [Aerococcaceae bacterium zg-BR33]